MTGSKKQVSLYFHIPFCTHKCGYCHFYVVPDKDQFKKTLLTGLKKEWALRLPELVHTELVSIYFGGGTPSLFGPDNIGSILEMIQKDVGFNSEATEITLEANPENITKQLMQDYAHAGINRVSIGIQTLDDSILHTLERQHGATKAIDAVHATANSGIHNITVDLMYDLPGQTVEIWESTLTRARELPITHLSLYNLTIEPHTTFFKHQEQILKTVPDPEASLKMYEMAQAMLSEKKLKQYEISAFAKEGYQSIHNTGYWKARPFIGFGPSAFSYWQGKRFRNIPNLNRYSMQLKDDTFPIDFEERLDPQASLRELLAVRIRLTEGVDLPEFEKVHGVLDQGTHHQIDELIQKKLIERKKGVIYLSKEGILFYDSVAVELI
jgi:oxygen-independent coproporphyrinogen III oxidase